MTTVFTDHRATATQSTLPVSSGTMIRRLAEAAVLPERFRPHTARPSRARRDTFRPRTRDRVLMWVATALLPVAASSLATAVLLVR